MAFIGQAVKRKEDFRFLTGGGNYTDDINRPRQTYAYILRSPHAHANIRTIDVSAAKKAPDHVAVFIAETKDQAKDAAALIDIDYQELPAIIATGDAMEAGAAQVWEAAKNNVCYDWELGDKAATEAAFAKAAQVVKIDIVNNRLIPNAMEPRAAIREYDRATGDSALYTTSQNPHVIRLLMGAFVLQIPEHKLRVVAPDVGGGFGSKIYHYA